MFAPRLVALALAPTLLLCACGGSGADGGGPPPVAVSITVEAPSIPEGEGYVIDAAGVVDDTANVTLGDNGNDEAFVGVLCFDLTGIGDVTDAELVVHRGALLGNPLSLGTLYLDHIEGDGVLDPTNAFDGTLVADALVLADQPSWALDVTALVAADVVAGRATSTFRLRFALPTNGDATADFYRIISSTSAFIDSRPALTVTHVAP